MLEVAAETLGLEGGPQHVLVHSVGLNSPAREVSCVEGEFGGEGIDGGRVVEEEDLARAYISQSDHLTAGKATYSAVGSLEHVELVLRGGELVLGHLRLQHLLDVLPELLVLFVEQHDKSSGLRVEG